MCKRRISADEARALPAVREMLAADVARNDAGEAAYRCAASIHNPGSDVRVAAVRTHSDAVARALAAREALRALVEAP